MMIKTLLGLCLGTSLLLHAGEHTGNKADTVPADMQRDKERQSKMIKNIDALVAAKQIDKAASLAKEGYERYPDNTVIMRRYATLLFWQGHSKEADSVFQNLLVVDPDTAQLPAYRQNKILLHVQKMQTLLAAAPKKAAAYAQTLEKSIRESYDLHLLYIQALIRSGELAQAEREAKLFYNDFPKSSEAQQMFADLLFWQGHYAESLKHYHALYAKTPSPALKEKISEVESAQQDAFAKLNIVEQIKHYKVCFEEQQKPRDGLKLAQLYLKTGAVEPALEVLESLARKYPRDLEITRLYMVSLLNTYHKSDANHLLYRIDEEERALLQEKYPFVYCRTLVNKLEIGGYAFTYSDQRYSDNTFYIQYETPIQEYILVALLQETWRYGLRDTDIQADLYRAFEDQWWGYLTFSFSPEANFMPNFGGGGHLYKDIGPFELGFGYEYSHYSNSDVHMFVPEYSYYFWSGFTWNQKLYYVPASKSYAIFSLLGYESSCHYKLQVEYTWANSNERIERVEVFQNSKSNELRIAGEYRLMPEWAVGGSLSWGSYVTDVDQYSKDGLQLYIRRAW